MIHESRTFPVSDLADFQRDFITEDMILFDIETTGLSSARDFVYLIGCSSLTGEDISIDLFFAENTDDEAAVFEAFMPVLEVHSTVITFNGTTFDIPFLKKRHPAFCPVFDRMESLDLYRVAGGMKPLLRLESYKQKSIERFLGCAREDLYSGGELIGMYLEYTLHQNRELLRYLLLHNFEDVKGMYDLLGLLSYCQLKEGRFRITKYFTKIKDDFDVTLTCPDRESAKEYATSHNENVCPAFCIAFETDCPFPQNISITDDCACLFLSGRKGLACFPIRHDELKYFFADYENYYYLPAEDYAVHRSVGEFVDASHRRKATAKTCYMKKECDYITLPCRGHFSRLRTGYSDKCFCQPLPASEEELATFLQLYFSRFFK